MRARALKCSVGVCVWSRSLPSNWAEEWLLENYPQALEAINENLDNEETVALTAIAALVQISYSNFSRAFKQSMGVTPNGHD